MSVVFLGQESSPIACWLKDVGESVYAWQGKLRDIPVNYRDYDVVVSHGYRHIIQPDVIAHFGKRIVNVHISLLPWNRGADPNLWSFLEDTPAGVSIHEVDEGLDTGPILAQKEMMLGDEHTLSTSYNTLQQAAFELFTGKWAGIRNGSSVARAQAGAGTYHRLKDKEPYIHLLTEKGWDTPVALIRGVARGL